MLLRCTLYMRIAVGNPLHNTVKCAGPKTTGSSCSVLFGVLQATATRAAVVRERLEGELAALHAERAKLTKQQAHQKGTTQAKSNSTVRHPALAPVCQANDSPQVQSGK